MNVGVLYQVLEYTDEVDNYSLYLRGIHSPDTWQEYILPSKKDESV